MKKEGVALEMFIVCALLLTGLVSAGILEDIKDSITGHATSQDTNVSVTIVGTAKAQIYSVSSIPAQSPVENSYTNVTFSAVMCDPDGVSDLNDTSVSANFTRLNEAVRSNSTCSHVSDLNGTCANYSCTIDMWYFDGAGVWNVTVSGTDLGNLSLAQNTTTSFTFNQLKAMVIFPFSLNWTAISPGGINQTASNDPTTINNTGNFNGTVAVTGLDLFGETITTEVFGVDNFTVNVLNGGSPPAECQTDFLQNATLQNVTNSAANVGNLSSGSGAGQEELYYCIPLVPSISSQEYSTVQAGGSWTVLYN